MTVTLNLGSHLERVGAPRRRLLSFVCSGSSYRASSRNRPCCSIVRLSPVSGLVEICRQRHKLADPGGLSSDYFEALKMVAGLVCAASVRQWDSDFLKCALSVIAVSKGFALIAESLQELDGDTAELLLKGR